ncbi:MAG: TPM domain-containing protein [Steroidobacteraceae bacterium]
MIAKPLALLALALLVSAAPTARTQEGLQPIPALETRVTDRVGLLDAATRASLEARLTEFETRKGSQIAVLIVPSTAPEAIEQYSIRVVDAWKLGRKGVDDGALLLVASEDRAVRIEVGRGLEGALTDLTANRIIDEIIVPQFRSGDFAAGIAAGLDRMIRVVDGEPLPEPEPGWSDKSGGSFGDLVGLLFFVVLAVSAMLRAILGRFLGSLATGSVIGTVAWFVSGTLLASVGAGVLAFIFALVLGFVPASALSSRGRRGGFGSGHWGGGFGGGGFGGGGGGFGGGGASGRW